MKESREIDTQIIELMTYFLETDDKEVIENYSSTIQLYVDTEVESQTKDLREENERRKIDRDHWVQMADIGAKKLIELEKQITQLKKEKEEMVSMLKHAKCPDIDCDNKGTTTDVEQTITPECCGNFDQYGGCCNSPVPKQEFQQVAAPCQFCYERDRLTNQKQS